jgi:hypothetical protein
MESVFGSQGAITQLAPLVEAVADGELRGLFDSRLNRSSPNASMVWPDLPTSGMTSGDICRSEHERPLVLVDAETLASDVWCSDPPEAYRQSNAKRS